MFSHAPDPDVQCPALQIPDNGKVDQTENSFGSTATYSCDSQYQLVGDVTRTCQSEGTWSGSEPSCVGEVLRSELGYFSQLMWLLFYS